jgi:hypothetical protein
MDQITAASIIDKDLVEGKRVKIGIRTKTISGRGLELLLILLML